MVLAGGPPDAVAALQPGAPNKAFVRVAGIELVARTLASLRESAHVGRTIVVAPAAARGHEALARAGEIRDDGPHITDSLRSGLAGLDPDELVLIATADLPVLGGAAVDEFAAAVIAADADIAYSCVERGVHEAAFPDVPHTWARLREGTYCGGGLGALRPRVFPALARFMDRLGAARKNPLRLASIFGYDVLAKYAAGRLTIADATARASALLEARAHAIVCTHPDIAVNVDRPSDVALAERILAQASSETN